MPNLCTRWSFVVVAALLLAVGRADAQSVTLAWDPNTESNLAGYIIGFGTSSGQNQKTVDVGMATQWTLAGLSEGTTYYFRVFAYDTAGTRSRPSKEVSTTIPTSGSTSGGCIGPAPAAGWECINGGWVPPDSPLLGTSPPPAPAPAPAPTGCIGSAPGAGWVCKDGNWLPPDSPLLSGLPTAPAPSGSTPCPGSAPGTGWVCKAGNWLPPDHPLLFATPPPSTPTACPGSSPGLGWICQDGNWLPPDHPLVRRSGGGD